MNSYLNTNKASQIQSNGSVVAFKNSGLKLEDNRGSLTVQKKKNNTGLPNGLKSGIENPGRVKPAKQLKSKVHINDDFALEKEADVMGEKALQKHSANKSPIQRVKSISSGIIQRIPQWIRRVGGGVASIAGAAGGAVMGGIRGAYDGAMTADDEGSHGILGTAIGLIADPLSGAYNGAITGARKGMNRPVGMGSGTTAGSVVGGFAGSTAGGLLSGVAGGIASTAGRIIGGTIGHTIAGATSLSAGAVGAITGAAGGVISGFRQDGLMGVVKGGITGAALGGAAGLAAGYMGPVAAGAVAGGALGSLVGNMVDEHRLRRENKRQLALQQALAAQQAQQVAVVPPPASHQRPGKTHITYTTGYITQGDKHYRVGKKMVADLWPDDPVHGSATGDNWPWMQALSRRYAGAKIVRGHLLNHDLGGIAKPENLYPISTRANVAHSAQVEQVVKKLVRDESVKGVNEKHVHYEVTVGETNPHNPAEAWFDCAYSVEGVVNNRVRIDSNLGTDRGGFGGGTKINPLSGTGWHHGKRRGFQDADWQSYRGSHRIDVEDGAPPPNSKPVEYPVERNISDIIRRRRRRNH